MDNIAYKEKGKYQNSDVTFVTNRHWHSFEVLLSKNNKLTT